MYVIERWKGKKCIVGEQLNNGSRLKTFGLSDACSDQRSSNDCGLEICLGGLDRALFLTSHNQT
jgi:hypothetical protein